MDPSDWVKQDRNIQKFCYSADSLLLFCMTADGCGKLAFQIKQPSQNMSCLSLKIDESNCGPTTSPSEIENNGDAKCRKDEKVFLEKVWTMCMQYQFSQGGSNSEFDLTLSVRKCQQNMMSLVLAHAFSNGYV